MTEPRFQWPAQAMMPHAEPRAQVQPEPAPVAPSGPASSTVVPVADGWHLEWRFWVVRQSDVLHPIVTIQGWNGPHGYTEAREMEGASLAKVKRLIEQTQARLAADAAKKRAKGRRS